jgi:flagellar hook protein FlgE
MRLESALYASREGLQSHGNALSVVGDNVANTSTTGFKKTRAEFADIFADTASENSIGSGAMISKTRTLFEGGVLEGTNRSLDFGIDGGGFFVLQEGAETLYSRAGAFSINQDGLLVDADGRTVMGLAADGTTLNTINMLNTGSAAVATTQIAISGNLNSSDPIGTLPVAPTSWSDITESGAASFIQNINLYDSLGNSRSVTLAFAKSDASSRNWSVQAYIDGEDVTGGTAGQPVSLGTLSNYTFGEDGTIPAEAVTSAALTLSNISFSNGAAAGNVTIDLSNFTQYASGSTVNSISNNGQGTGEASGYEVTSSGEIVAVLDSGARKTLATLALAKFVNQDGLIREGSSLFDEGDGVGARTIATANSSGLGQVQSGALELSNVDISEEFVDLIMYQRGYQASSQTLNAASALIRETLQLIR